MLGPVIKRCAKMRGTPGMDNIIRDTTERDAPTMSEVVRGTLISDTIIRQKGIL